MLSLLYWIGWGLQLYCPTPHIGEGRHAWWGREEKKVYIVFFFLLSPPSCPFFLICDSELCNYLILMVLWAWQIPGSRSVAIVTRNCVLASGLLSAYSLQGCTIYITQCPELGASCRAYLSDGCIQVNAATHCSKMLSPLCSPGHSRPQQVPPVAPIAPIAGAPIAGAPRGGKRVDTHLLSSTSCSWPGSDIHDITSRSTLLVSPPMDVGIECNSVQYILHYIQWSTWDTSRAF